ncbi:hypothetical protein M9H77_24144 [Catharanthus roseus]|uniref:Uncharacterized protein n=1 Tax=Catharanthus roseus TaxID=4058 RepID=A0ACC0AW92_CATRO|nr:hypothetical protein M9H77_24144 [Catharanthus roseus]
MINSGLGSVVRAFLEVETASLWGYYEERQRDRKTKRRHVNPNDQQQQQQPNNNITTHEKARQTQMVILFANTYEKPHSDQGINSGYDLVFGSIRGLHCTWLVPRTRASSDGVDDSNLGEWIHLKRGVDHGGCGPIGLRGHCIMLSSAVQPPSGESGGART